jgi:hypothetical protein
MCDSWGFCERLGGRTTLKDGYVKGSPTSRV